MYYRFPSKSQQNSRKITPTNKLSHWTAIWIANEKKNMLACFLFVCLFCQVCVSRDRIVPQSFSTSFDVSPTWEDDSSPDSLFSVGVERRRKSDKASGPPYVYLIFQLGPICRTCGSFAVFTTHSVSTTSCQWVFFMNFKAFSQMPPLFYIYAHVPRNITKILMLTFWESIFLFFFDQHHSPRSKKMVSFTHKLQTNM